MVELSQSLFDSGRMGLVVLDRHHAVSKRLGKLVDWLSPGVKVTEAVPFLVGLEEVLDEIAAERRVSFMLPRMKWVNSEAGEWIFSLEVLPGERPGQVHIVFRDETEIATLEQEVIQQRNELALVNERLEKARRHAEQALRDKAAFFANISHDLKTPLQVIMGNVEILRTARDDDMSRSERNRFLEDIHDNSVFLLNLITDLLEASSLDVSQVELVEEPTDLGDMLQRLLTMVRQLPGGAGLRLDLTMDDHPAWIMADPMRLQRLLLNILSNAVKFTDDRGHIAVSARRAEDESLVIEVKDDGCGIEAEMLAHVFEPFTRSGRAEGSGLGLHIAKGLADLHDADLTLSSQPGAGTTAMLRLPKSRLIGMPS